MQTLTKQELCLYDLPPVARDRLLDVLKTVLDRAEALLSPRTIDLLAQQHRSFMSSIYPIFV